MPGPRARFEARIEAAVAQCDDLSAEQRAKILTQHANQLRTQSDADRTLAGHTPRDPESES